MPMQTAVSLLLGLLCAAALTGCPPHNPTPIAEPLDPPLAPPTISPDRPQVPDVMLPAR
jgi:hypothetical protein